MHVKRNLPAILYFTCWFKRRKRSDQPLLEHAMRKLQVLLRIELFCSDENKSFNTYTLPGMHTFFWENNKVDCWKRNKLNCYNINWTLDYINYFLFTLHFTALQLSVSNDDIACFLPKSLNHEESLKGTYRFKAGK